MTEQQTISQFISFLKVNHPLPENTSVSFEVQSPDDFKYPKSWWGACKRVSPKCFRITIQHRANIEQVIFSLGHEYKHVLQFCYEGMKSSDKDLKGLGYHYRQWEIPANHFANETIAAYKSTLK